MGDTQSIKDTLSVIRKALEEDPVNSDKKINESVLILNQLVGKDGTINSINESNINKTETIKILNHKLDEIFEKYLTKWLDNNVPQYLERYFKNKDLK